MAMRNGLDRRQLRMLKAEVRSPTSIPDHIICHINMIFSG